jgi:hypothetical protein
MGMLRPSPSTPTRLTLDELDGPVEETAQVGRDHGADYSERERDDQVSFFHGFTPFLLSADGTDDGSADKAIPADCCQ